MKSVFRISRVCVKTLISKVRLVPSFCKDCGADVHDFIAPSQLWKVVSRTPKVNVLCYGCFCDRCRRLGLESVFKIVN